MPKLNRVTLKNLFKSGALPSGESFADLIDSMVNKIDDTTTSSTPGSTPVVVAPDTTASQGSKSNPNDLVSFFKHISELKTGSPIWTMQMGDEPDGAGIGISEPTPSATQPANSTPRLYIKKGGNVGIGTTIPAHQLDVSGFIGMQGRTGTFNQQGKDTQIPANGKWQQILTGLDGLQAFEIVAAVSGEKGKGKYSILHAIALSAFGQSKSSISKTIARYGWRTNRIDIRWTGKTHSYNLELRTCTDYGTGINIKYSIIQLWSDTDNTEPAVLKK